MARPEQKSLPETAQEVWELVKAYVRQETIDPLKGAGRYVGYGLGGSLCLGVGAVLLLVGLLRLLQTETGGTFDGNWSWAPYFLVTATAAFVIAIVVSRVQRRGRDRL